ncbi:hypothetical protein [Pseudoxanthomonas sp.]|uniref:hypothetical protein n=1 Tax=Pseudoxanthomonas sp. TaxID=1871049 RepID=UPI002606B63F|nr:hypothetical protein [Pseudoxanthomonas sp.]WDS37327.1 MAG: hypothetical protein O8I58_05440 [Pseudoxanthomonas sp.]
MKKRSRLLSLSALCLLLGSWQVAAPLYAAEPAVERLGVPGPLSFAGQSFELSWSSHPTPDLYKQEYVPAGQDVERYRDMLMIDVRIGGANASQMALAIDAQVQERRKSDPVANSEVVISADGTEATVDMLMSATGDDGQVFVEWSAHRYVTDTSGQGTRMFGITRRAYGDQAVTAMLQGLKQKRVDEINALKTSRMPEIELAR